MYDAILRRSRPPGIRTGENRNDRISGWSYSRLIFRIFVSMARHGNQITMLPYHSVRVLIWSRKRKSAKRNRNLFLFDRVDRSLVQFGKLISYGRRVIVFTGRESTSEIFSVDIKSRMHPSVSCRNYRDYNHSHMYIADDFSTLSRLLSSKILSSGNRDDFR